MSIEESAKSSQNAVCIIRTPSQEDFFKKCRTFWIVVRIIHNKMNWEWRIENEELLTFTIFDLRFTIFVSASICVHLCHRYLRLMMLKKQSQLWKRHKWQGKRQKELWFLYSCALMLLCPYALFAKQSQFADEANLRKLFNNRILWQNNPLNGTRKQSQFNGS